jgi:hypothetical protein
MAWISRMVAEASECLSPFEHCSWGSTVAIPVCKRYRCDGLVESKMSSQWHAVVLVVGHDHECHNCHLVEHSIATHPTDAETAPMTLTYERVVPSARKYTTVSSRALAVGVAARPLPYGEIARRIRLPRQGNVGAWTWRISCGPVSGYLCRVPEDHLRHEICRSLRASNMV